MLVFVLKIKKRKMSSVYRGKGIKRIIWH